MSTWNVEILRTSEVAVQIEKDTDDPGAVLQEVLDFLRGRRPGDPLPEGAPHWQLILREAYDDGMDLPDRGPAEWSPLFHEVRMYDDEGMDLVEPTEV